MAPARTSCSSRSMPQSDTDSLAVQACRLTRMVDMWFPGSDLVTTGKEMQSMTDDELLKFHEGANQRKLQIITLAKHLSEWELGFFERLNRAGPHATATINTGQTMAAPRMHRRFAKQCRGGGSMKHKQCAEELAPPNLDFTDENVVKQFTVDGIPAVTPDSWAWFMWAKGQYSRQHPSAGLLEGELMFLVATAILFSPSSSMPSTIQATGGARGHIWRRGPIGITKKYELTEVTPVFIAYVACVFLENPKYERWTAGLMNCWNEKLFSGHQFAQSAAAVVDPASTTLNMLDAELEALEIAPGEIGLPGPGEMT
ncbi:hypothetical protein FRC10_012233, partial [Ceratobasidium sp. 414]